MMGHLKRLALGRITSREKKYAVILVAVSLLFVSFVAPSYLFLPLFISSLTLPYIATLALGLLLCIPALGLGLSPGMAAACFSSIVWLFRKLLAQENTLARERQDLLKTLVHELRNPLFAAKGTIDNLSTRLHELDAESLEMQLIMASAAMQSINQEVDDLTQLLRLESGRLVAHPETIELAEIFEKLRRRFPTSVLEDRTLTFHGGNLETTCDALLMLQTLDKLVSNALVHSQGGPITVVARSAEQSHEIEVIDEGPGIPIEKRRDVFQKFTGLGNSNGGFGLGLYLAQQYVLAQDGELTLEESEKGCRFRISLPQNQTR